ncbi:MAG: CbiX/SirB N-terminal domain-containing protein [Candidatus Atribacteria bacterium]|nr:CbiX/SirB N-terminal domain-containing protein [Candidatus Atribacteria bacterium]
MNSALLILVHGSRAEGSQKMVFEIAEKLKRKGEYQDVEVAYLQFNHPDLAESVERLVENGIAEIITVPAFLFQGIHVIKDIPMELKKVKDRYPKVRIALANPIGYDDRICDVISDRAKGRLIEIC